MASRKLKALILTAITYLGLSMNACDALFDNYEARMNDVKEKIIEYVNNKDDINLDIETAVARNMVRSTKKQAFIDIIAADETAPYFIRMNFTDNSNFNNYGHMIDVLKYISENFEGIEKNADVLKASKNILDYVNKLSGTRENNILERKYSKHNFEEGKIDNIVIYEIKPGDNVIKFNISSALKESNSYLAYNPIHPFVPYHLEKKTDYYEYLKLDTISVPMTAEYRDNPLLAVENYLAAAVNNKKFDSTRTTEYISPFYTSKNSGFTTSAEPVNFPKL